MRPIIVIALCVGLSACDGLISGPAPSILGPGTIGSPRPSPTTSPSPTPTSTPTPSPTPPPPVVPGQPIFARLTVEQYRLTTEALLGAPLPAVELDPDTTPHLYASIGAARTTVSERLMAQLEVASRALTASVFADPLHRTLFVGCAPADANDPCIGTFLERFGRRAFRRTITADELARFRALITAQTDVNKGLRMATSAILQSPSFLYRVERGTGTGTKIPVQREEMASRLAFLIWNAGPDQALLDAAERGALDTIEGIKAELPRLMADPRAPKAARSFFAEYLGAGSFDTLDRDPTRYPRWEPGLGTSMRGELERFVELLVQGGGDLRRLFDQRDTFVDEKLARFYGLPPVSGWTQVRFPDASMRGGILSLGGVLAFTSHAGSTSPTRRGVFIRERLLCETIPAPPPDVVTELPPPGGTAQTVRARLAEHRRNPRCATCHASFDPLGLGLEEFDASGSLRTEEAGMPVDNSGVFEGNEFHGARELGTLFASDPRVARCLARQVFRRALGRLDTNGEYSAIDQMASDLERGGYRWNALIEAIATNEAFRFVTPETP